MFYISNKKVKIEWSDESIEEVDISGIKLCDMVGERLEIEKDIYVRDMNW